MTYERWENLCEMVRSKLQVLNQGQEELTDSPGHREWLEFKGPAGELRLELVVRPRVTNVKTIYSKRMGSQSTVQYEYDPVEHTLTLHVYRRELSGNWQEVSADTLAQGLS